jgi:hypothetical protein
VLCRQRGLVPGGSGWAAYAIVARDAVSGGYGGGILKSAVKRGRTSTISPSGTDHKTIKIFYDHPRIVRKYLLQQSYGLKL